MLTLQFDHPRVNELLLVHLLREVQPGRVLARTHTQVDVCMVLINEKSGKYSSLSIEEMEREGLRTCRL